MNKNTHNTGTVLAFEERKAEKAGNRVKTPKFLLFRTPATIFSQYCFTIIRRLAYFCNLKKNFVEENLKSDNQLQMADIFVKDAVLSAFALELSAVEKLLQETDQRQDYVLKLKEIDDEQLRMVVQL